MAERKRKKIIKQPWALKKGDRDRYYGEILEREHIFSGIHRLYATAYKKDKNKFIRIDKSGPIPDVGKYYHQQLSINNEKHWTRLARAINVLAVYLGWATSAKQSEFQELVADIAQEKDAKKIRSTAVKRLRRNKKLKKEIDSVREQLAELMQLYRTTNLPQFRKSLKDFKALISSNVTERKCQEFFKDSSNTWILGLEYIAVNRHAKAGTAGFPDFVPERFDGFHDIVEFKRPNDSVFVFKNAHWRQSVPLKDGVSQLMDYLELFDRKPQGSDEITEQPTKYRASGLLIIGNLSGNVDKKKLQYVLRLHNSFLSRINIMTYDELYDQAYSVIERIEKESKKNKA